MIKNPFAAYIEKFIGEIISNKATMKKNISLLAIACLGLPLFAGNDEINVKSTITSVTVFLSGAQVTRTGQLTLAPGSKTFVFAGLPQNINPQSLQVKGTGNYTILSVTHRLNYMMSRQKSSDIKMLEDSILILKNQLSLDQSTLTVTQEEENFLLANKSIGGQNTGVNVNDLKTAADLLRTRLTETGRIKIRTNQDIASLNEKIARIASQLNSLNAANAPTSEVAIATSVKSAGDGSMSLSYLVQNAGWTPEYDLRAVDVKNPVELTYKANVFQTSNEDWKNVQLTLSTGNPAQEGTKPELQPWYLSFMEFYPLKSSRNMQNAPSEVLMDKMEVRDVVASGYSSMVEVTTGQTTASFAISIPYSIPSDGKMYMVEIQKTTLPASYEYQSVPKLDPDAFLIARVTGWEDLNLQSGDMSLFFEGTFVGKSSLDMQNTRDTLDISLGRDKNIVIKRERKKDFTGSQFLGSNRKDSRAFDISVRNNKKQDVNLVIFDQVPVSTNKDITVNTTELSGAAYAKESGLLRWDLLLKPGESKTLRMAFEVKYPKDKKVVLE